MYHAGIDVGGTKVYSVVMTKGGDILSRAKEKTGNAKGWDNVLQLMHKVYLDAVQRAGVSEADIATIGIAVPGAVDTVNHIVIEATNLGWSNQHYAPSIASLFGTPFYFDNDVNMGAYGEFSLGALGGDESTSQMYAIFVGTGVGGGYINDSVIQHSSNHTVGEIGHSIIQLDGPLCACGLRGCLEALASKTGMTAYMKVLADGKDDFDVGRETLLNKVAPEWRTKIVGSKALRKCYQKNDLVVRKAMNRSARAIGAAIGNLITNTGIECFVLGGGVIEEMPDVMMKLIRESLAQNTFCKGDKGVHLHLAKLGDDAVAAGAALYARDKPTLLIKK